MTQVEAPLIVQDLEMSCEPLEPAEIEAEAAARAVSTALEVDAAQADPETAIMAGAPRVLVVGVGGAGGNAVNTMIRKELQGVEYLVANTDAQALAGSLSQNRLQLGAALTRGLGAGGKPEIGQKAAEESAEAIKAALEGAQMAFIAAGMGGGTGTGAAPQIARIARDMGLLTVGVVSKPFDFEGGRRQRAAEEGVAALAEVVDTIIVIPNQNLFRVASERTGFAEAFLLADEVLHQGVKGVTDLMIKPGLVNLDFADVRAVIDGMGPAMMGSGEAEGEDRARQAAERAVENPLLDEVTLRGAKGVLINVVGGPDLTLYEVDAAANRVRQDADPEACILFGSTIDPQMEGRMRVCVVATGVERVAAGQALSAPAEPVREPAPTVAVEAEIMAPTPSKTEAAPAETPVAGAGAAPGGDLIRKLAGDMTPDVAQAVDAAATAVSVAVSESAATEPTPARGLSRPTRESSRVEIPSFLRRHTT